MSSLQRRFGFPIVYYFIRATCLAHFLFALVTYWTMTVTLVLRLMIELWNLLFVLLLLFFCLFLFFSFPISTFLSMARLAYSSFFTNAFMTDRVRYPHAITGKTHWLKTFLFRLIGRCLSRKISLYCPKTSHPVFIPIETSFLFFFFFFFFLVLCSIAIVCSRHFSSSPSIYLSPIYLFAVCCVHTCQKFVFFIYVF